MATMTGVQAIRAFFEADDGRRVALAELQALALEERLELAAHCAKELNVELKSAPISETEKKS